MRPDDDFITDNEKYQSELPYLEWIYEKWRLMVMHDGDLECTLAVNKEGDHAVFLTRGGSPVARVVCPGDLDEWIPCFETSEDLNTAFSEASEDDWRRNFEDFKESSAPVVKRINQYAAFIQKKAEQRKEEGEDYS